MAIRFRFVPYGTSFHAKSGPRPDDERDLGALYENEIAADVGAMFWESPDGNPLAVIDHHFARPDQFPSAAAAVMHSARLVADWWRRAASFEEVKLVTHVNPDFDALASLYLIRHFREWSRFDPIEQRMAPDAWRDLTKTDAPPNGSRRFDWFRAPDPEMHADLRWRVFIAVLASYSDSSKRMPLPKSQSAPAILYAATVRNRAIQVDGASALFDYVREAIGKGFNPLTDAIFAKDTLFGPEVELLARESQAYERDVKRARRAVVTLPSYTGSFSDFYRAKEENNLLTRALEPVDQQLATDGPPRAVDGIYIRDPESILFKDLAREDFENSSMGRGFEFTAVAISRERPKGRINQTAYYFALDPERAGNLTLFPLWCRLETAEVRALHAPELEDLRKSLEGKKPRERYEHLAGDQGGLFEDPWFAGENFRTTLIATPWRGTEIGMGGAGGDLTDDPLVEIVRAETEYSAFHGRARIVEYSNGALEESEADVRQARETAQSGRFRFCSVAVAEGLEIQPGLHSRQIGEQLWRLLQPVSSGLATDFENRHLTQDRELIAVWTRRGISVAYRSEAADRVKESEELFLRILKLLEQAPEVANAKDQAALERIEELLRAVTQLRHELNIPGKLLALRRFVDAIGFHETLATARDLLSSQVERLADARAQETARRANELANETRRFAEQTSESSEAVKEGNERVELLEILFATFYGIEMLHILLGALKEGPAGALETRILTLLGAALALLASVGLMRRKKTQETRSLWKDPIPLVPVLTAVVLVVGFACTFKPMSGWASELLGTPKACAECETANPSPTPAPAISGVQPIQQGKEGQPAATDPKTPSATKSVNGKRQGRTN